MKKPSLSLEWLEGRVVPSAVPVPIKPPSVPYASPPVWSSPVNLAAPASIAPSAPAPVVTPKPTPAPVTNPKPTPTPVSNPTVNQRFLAGSGSGTYISTLKVMATPSGFHMNGTANINGMGLVNVYAHMYTVGFKTIGNARGELTLSNRLGSVTLQLTGPTQPQHATLPETFTYRVMKVSGSYSSVSETGTLRLIRTLDASPIRNGIQYFETGSFKLVI